MQIQDASNRPNAGIMNPERFLSARSGLAIQPPSTIQNASLAIPLIFIFPSEKAAAADRTGSSRGTDFRILRPVHQLNKPFK
jgi:hypothetical protein